MNPIFFAKYFAAVFLFSSFSCFVGAQSPAQIKISQYDPAPTYPLTKNSADISELTDGALEAHPMWLKESTVGWRDNKSVRIDIDVINKPKNGVLRFHTDCGDGAGAYFPQRIDVYSAVGAGWIHAGEANLLPPPPCDQQTWIEVYLKSVADKLVAIVHANGRFVFFDEISLQSGALSTSAPLAPVGLAVQMVHSGTTGESQQVGPILSDVQSIPSSSLITDSAGRLSRAHEIYAAQQNNAAIETIKGNSSAPLIIWEQDPWAPHEMWSQSTDSISGDIGVEGTSAESQSICIGLLPTDDSIQSVSVSTSPIISPEQVRFRRLSAVTAANGLRVYDHLAEVEGGRLPVRKQEPSYLWIDLNLASFGQGIHDFNLKLGYGSGREISVPISMDVVAPPPTKALKVVTWAYPDEEPIWRNREDALAELLKGGANVFVVPPRAIPGIKLDGAWESQIARELDSQIKMNADNGEFLLFLGWSDTRNPLQSEKSHKDFREWLIAITTHLESLGVPREKWALYPTDEPQGNALDFLLDVTQLTHDIDPKIRVYANPVFSSSLSTDTIKLTNLRDKISIWQPDLSLLDSIGGSVLRQSKNALWLYAVPPEPAKLASPIQFYRSLAWQAWRFGASGVGFWSFSDTAGSSALDDKDGKRPDYAVVYERSAGNGVDSSRRWEAFKQGVMDYQVLSSGGIKPSAISSANSYDSAAMKAVRAQALDKIRSAR